jgi:hypothetical protein
MTIAPQVAARALPADQVAPASLPFAGPVMQLPEARQTTPAGDPDSLPLPPASADMKLTLLGGLTLGDRLLVETADLRLTEGELVGSSFDTLLLWGSRGEEQVALASVDRLWMRGRSVKEYAKGGAIVGGVLGGLMFGLLAPMLSQIDDGEPSGPFTAGDEVKAIAVGALLGGGALGVAGGIVGAAVPSWHLRYRSPLSPQPADAPPGSSKAHRPDAPEVGTPIGRVGTSPPGGASPEGAAGKERETATVSSPPTRSDRVDIAFDSGVHHGSGKMPTRTIPYLQLDCAYSVSRTLAIGVEAGTSLNGHPQLHEETHPGGGRSLRSENHAVSHLGLTTRVAFDEGTPAPYAIGSLGTYRWSEGYLGYSIGVGLRMSWAGVFRVVRIEGRFHGNLETIAGEYEPRFFTLTLGVQPAAW